MELTPACNEASFGKAPREARAGAGAHGAAFCSSVGSTGAAHKNPPALSVLTAEALYRFGRLARLRPELPVEPGEEPHQTGPTLASFGRAPREAGAGAGAHGAAHKKAPALPVLTAEALQSFGRLARLWPELPVEPGVEPHQTGHLTPSSSGALPISHFHILLTR